MRALSFLLGASARLFVPAAPFAAVHGPAAVAVQRLPAARHAPPVLLAPGTVDAPGWVLPLFSLLVAGIPLVLLTFARMGSAEALRAKGPSLPAPAAAPAVTPSADEGVGVRHPQWLEVLETPSKGRGLFSCAHIPRGSFLFDYEGERIDEVEYRRRYPDRVSDYAVGVKKNGIVTFIDAADPALSGVARYMNHSAARPNVKMQVDLVAQPPRVLMYAAKDIEDGDELVWNYGIGYVQAHPDLIEDEARRPAVDQQVSQPAGWPMPRPAV